MIRGAAKCSAAALKDKRVRRSNERLHQALSGSTHLEPFLRCCFPPHAAAAARPWLHAALALPPPGHHLQENQRGFVRTHERTPWATHSRLDSIAIFVITDQLNTLHQTIPIKQSGLPREVSARNSSWSFDVQTPFFINVVVEDNELREKTHPVHRVQIIANQNGD